VGAWDIHEVRNVVGVAQVNLPLDFSTESHRPLTTGTNQARTSDLKDFSSGVRQVCDTMLRR
jgi:hypothetical protein